MKIVIIDYGLGNLRSIEKALEYVGADVEISKDISVIDCADALVLPGVGAFRDAMMHFATLERVVKDAVDEGKPLLGICLGMQMLASQSEEGGLHRGIDIIPGRVIRFPASELKVPHMGWNSLIIKKNIPLLKGIDNGSFVYFVHSYHISTDAEYGAALCDYGIRFPAVITNEAGNVAGTQFHPEKSGAVGLKMLLNFVESYGH
ncbi:imidazole glycerol phosphate synthase subunit hisH [Candidatus Methanoperedens nitroreducens]|uniref:Imidazole glycerol phosphate synthase subunit HisH n=1 Tax=Candidatus Methanoperedens nitratireducens TaxID=1392998 RepID=A0A062V9D7_9EURY|nr:imidazole glycerol phosphate synthase subunit HisH [Candidatus Methanoperedens nitroreducens]KCZ72369.1 imidazole glycerol phosphate synthase subunit hisH [Candidatus Methanoperedens nitroreducens]MDJ1423697.1 imidazole glycerol phosphate synthase subunit HisH [Candidatus Methanoperedens sp.]